MERDGVSAQTLARLSDLEGEYDMTIRVLAVLVERLQQLTECDEVLISVEAIDNQPDLVGRRVGDCVSLTTAR